jgi:hypothetical protein
VTKSFATRGLTATKFVSVVTTPTIKPVAVATGTIGAAAAGIEGRVKPPVVEDETLEEDEPDDPVTVPEVVGPVEDVVVVPEVPVVVVGVPLVPAVVPLTVPEVPEVPVVVVVVGVPLVDVPVVAVVPEVPVPVVVVVVGVPEVPVVVVVVGVPLVPPVVVVVGGINTPPVLPPPVVVVVVVEEQTGGCQSVTVHLPAAFPPEEQSHSIHPPPAPLAHAYPFHSPLVLIVTCGAWTTGVLIEKGPKFTHPSVDHAYPERVAGTPQVVLSTETL